MALSTLPNSQISDLYYKLLTIEYDERRIENQFQAWHKRLVSYNTRNQHKEIGFVYKRLNTGGIEMARTASGRTKAGATDWRPYPGGNGIFVDVDTSWAGFSDKVVYITSLGGRTNHWATTGGSSVYPSPPLGSNTPSGRGFRIFIRWIDGSPLTPETANLYGWHINWIGMEIE